jgi:hypothetical protein
VSITPTNLVATAFGSPSTPSPPSFETFARGLCRPRSANARLPLRLVLGRLPTVPKRPHATTCVGRYYGPVRTRRVCRASAMSRPSAFQTLLASRLHPSRVPRYE